MPQNQLIDPANTYVFMIGLLRWEDQSIVNFPATKRKDQDLYQCFLSRGIPPQRIKFLKDQTATLSHIHNELSVFLKEVPSQARCIFYYSGHGIKDKTGTYLANYDIIRDNMAATGLSLDLLSRIFQENFRGKSLFIFGECCHSGALIQIGEKLKHQEIALAIIGSSLGDELSSDSWAFTMALIEGLAGRFLIEPGGKGPTRMRSWVRYIQKALYFFEDQDISYFFKNIDPEMIVADDQASSEWPRPSESSPNLNLGDFVSVRSDLVKSYYRLVRFLEKEEALCEIIDFNFYRIRKVKRPLLEKLAGKFPPINFFF